MPTRQRCLAGLSLGTGTVEASARGTRVLWRNVSHGGDTGHEAIPCGQCAQGPAENRSSERGWWGPRHPAALRRRPDVGGGCSVPLPAANSNRNRKTQIIIIKK